MVCATKKVWQQDLVIPVKLSTFAFAELGAKCEIIKIVKRHHIFKASLHLTTFNLIIIYITYSTVSLEWDALVPQDAAILFELVFLSGPTGRALKHKEENNSPIQRKNSTKVQEMLSLCQWLCLKPDRNPGRDIEWQRRDRKGGKEPFDIKGCCDAFYLQCWRCWTRHLNRSTATAHWRQCKSLQHSKLFQIQY